MPTKVPTAEYQLLFIKKLQRLLDEGSFTSTYKYALLIAIADLSVENGSDTSLCLTLTKDEIADKFIRLYWKQAKLFPSESNKESVLFQNNYGQISVVTELIGVFKSTADKYSEFVVSTSQYKRTICAVSETLERGPLWRLQLLGGDSVDEFLYEQKNGENEIVLKSGIAFCFRSFYSQIISMVQNAWIQKIRANDQNQSMLGQNVPLREFLFSVQRNNLQVFYPLLNELQSSRCFYCCEQLATHGEVDHFVPWSRYSVDLGHNFVLACKGCNIAKGNLLASTCHLASWVNRNQSRSQELHCYFVENKIPQNQSTTCSVARWAYKCAEESESHLWVKNKQIVRATNAWESILSC